MDTPNLNPDLHRASQRSDDAPPLGAAADSQDPTFRKAAILVAALSPQEADRILDRFEPDQAFRLRQAMVDLGDVDPREQQRVLEEFFRVGPLVPGHQVAGIELHDGLLQRLSSTDDEPAPDARPFGFLQDTETERLARALADERPQTVALVLSHLPPQQAGQVLVRMAPAQQVDVIHRLIDLEETDPVVLREVERVLQTRLSRQVQMQRRRVAGLKAVAGILQASSGEVGTQILDNLSLRDQRLAEKLGPAPLEFDDLARAGDSLWQALLDSVDADLLQLALIGARPQLVQRVLNLLPTAEAQSLHAHLESPGPIRLRDVDLARRELANHARRLLAQTPGTASRQADRLVHHAA